MQIGLVLTEMMTLESEQVLNILRHEEAELFLPSRSVLHVHKHASRSPVELYLVGDLVRMIAAVGEEEHLLFRRFGHAQIGERRLEAECVWLDGPVFRVSESPTQAESTIIEFCDLANTDHSFFE